MKILVIEDNLEIVEALRYTLELRWPEATVVSTTMGEAGVELARNERPDIVFLDLGLPDITGFEVLHKIRSFSDVPVVVLTVRGDEIDKIQGFEMGADDYIVKPFSPGELLARVGALLRRRGILMEKTHVDGELFIKGKLSMDFVSNEIRVGDNQLKLSPTEIEILQVLVDNENKV
ncbi:MAG: response regulator transcription factor, partial [Chloroflexota bacterium]